MMHLELRSCERDVILGLLRGVVGDDTGWQNVLRVLYIFFQLRQCSTQIQLLSAVYSKKELQRSEMHSEVNWRKFPVRRRWRHFLRS